jgi:hypothetical protein
MLAGLVPRSGLRPEPHTLRPPQNGRMLRPHGHRPGRNTHFSTDVCRIEVIGGVLESLDALDLYPKSNPDILEIAQESWDLILAIALRNEYENQKQRNGKQEETKASGGR